MPRLADPCCDRCTHSVTTPCTRWVECVSAGQFCHESAACQAERPERLDRRIQGRVVRANSGRFSQCEIPH